MCIYPNRRTSRVLVPERKHSQNSQFTRYNNKAYIQHNRKPSKVLRYKTSSMSETILSILIGEAALAFCCAATYQTHKENEDRRRSHHLKRPQQRQGKFPPPRRISQHDGGLDDYGIPFETSRRLCRVPDNDKAKKKTGGRSNTLSRTKKKFGFLKWTKKSPSDDRLVRRRNDIESTFIRAGRHHRREVLSERSRVRTTQRRGSAPDDLYLI